MGFLTSVWKKFKKVAYFPQALSAQLEVSSEERTTYIIRHYFYHFSVRSPEDSFNYGRKYMEKFDVILNSTHPKVKRLIRKLKWINDKIGKNEVSVLFNKTYIYIKLKVLK